MVLLLLKDMTKRFKITSAFSLQALNTIFILLPK